jgi:glycosyltransferase involved in cell wall biosynthesis
MPLGRKAPNAYHDAVHVCLDIQSAISQRAGVGRYTKLLVEHLAVQPPADTSLGLFYFDFQRKGVPFAPAGTAQRACRWIPGRYVQKAWKTVGWPPFNWFAGPADVYHFPNFIRPPLSRGASVVTIHDLAFLRLPETIEERNLAYLTAQIRQTVQRANAIITVSRFTARELQELLAVPAARVHAVHSGLDPAMHVPAESDVRDLRRRLNLPGPYLLTVGTLEPRKNIPFLLEVFERLEKVEVDLVIAGRRGWKYEPILARLQQSPRRARIHLVEDLDERDLPALYGGAELFVLPSLYEGFGFPPLESMACGTPAVVSTGGSLPEVCGDAAVVIPEFDAALWAQEIRALLEAPGRLDALCQRGFSHARGFSWAETARQTWQVYQAALTDHQHRVYEKVPGYEI